MIKKLDLKDPDTAFRILELQTVSYSIEARMINFYGIPPLKDTIESLFCCDELFYGYYLEERLAGLISYNQIDTLIDICRLAIHPEVFRRGIADSLIDFVMNISSVTNRVIVSTGKNNVPAVNLYLNKGFNKVRDREIATGIYITEFEKVMMKPMSENALGEDLSKK
jgi:ribosomal protein S18 acetylase RimI-like enzyme